MSGQRSVETMCVGNAILIIINVSSQVSCWGEFRFHEVFDLLQHCIVTVVVASEVSCHTAVVENMQ